MKTMPVVTVTIVATIDLTQRRRRVLHSLVVVRPVYPAGRTGDQRHLPREVEAEGGGDAVVTLGNGGDGGRAP